VESALGWSLLEWIAVGGRVVDEVPSGPFNGEDVRGLAAPDSPHPQLCSPVVSVAKGRVQNLDPAQPLLGRVAPWLGGNSASTGQIGNAGTSAPSPRRRFWLALRARG